MRWVIHLLSPKLLLEVRHLGPHCVPRPLLVKGRLQGPTVVLVSDRPGFEKITNTTSPFRPHPNIGLIDKGPATAVLLGQLLDLPVVGDKVTIVYHVEHERACSENQIACFPMFE